MKKNKALLDTFHDLMFLIKGLMLIVFIAYLFSGTSLIKPGEVAIILRLGAVVGSMPEDRIRRAGWVFALPYPFDEVIRFPEKQIRETHILELFSNDQGSDEDSATIDPITEGYCISGDNNIFQVRASAKYQVSDPVKTIFGFYRDFSSLNRILHDLCVQEITQISAGFAIDGILTEHKEIIASTVKDKVQHRLDRIDSGLILVSVELAEIVPPKPLKDSFEEVNTAYIQRKKFVSEAIGKTEELLPKARAESEKTLKNAASYRHGVLARAESEAGSFLQLLEAYRQNRLQIRKDIRSDFRKRIFSNVANVVVLPDEELCHTGITTLIDNSRGSPLPPIDMQLYEEESEQ